MIDPWIYAAGAVIVGLLSGVVGAALAWFLIGRRDPIQTVFDMQDERAGVEQAPLPTGGGTAE